MKNHQKSPGAFQGFGGTLGFVGQNLFVLKKFVAIPLLYILGLYFLQRFIPFSEKSMMIFAALNSLGLALLGAYVGVGWGRYILQSKAPKESIVPFAFTAQHKMFFITLIGLHFLTSVFVSLILIVFQGLMKSMMSNILSTLFVLAFIQLGVSLFLSARLKGAFFEVIVGRQVNLKNAWHASASYWKSLMGSLFFVWISLVTLFALIILMGMMVLGMPLQPNALLSSVVGVGLQSPLLHILFQFFEMLLFLLQFTCIGLFYRIFNHK